ncbi:hypothetical protein FSP39_000845 [Pinctada imbricata]|uniref:Sulfotransferase domain-containing protein n=1 Tax=Pinctada imbricata TaxID=66713 RepID=A0AA88XEP8_PINIB|nr:hypothetical protein FSP39_000845 [Pinctada imbricata]
MYVIMSPTDIQRGQVVGTLSSLKRFDRARHGVPSSQSVRWQVSRMRLYKNVDWSSTKSSVRLVTLGSYPRIHPKIEMDQQNFYREGHTVRKDGEIEFEMLTIDGIALPEFPPARQPGGYPKRLNEIINMDTRPGDIILATYPKNGTHWMSEILDMLVRGSADYSKEKLVKLMESLPDMEMIYNLQSPRILNTHLPYKWFPRKHIQNGGKIIHCARNPKDTYVSFYHHCSAGMELGPKTKGMTWTQFFDNCVIGKACLYGTWFDYMKEMEQAKKNNKNIYTVHFERIKQDPAKEIKALAAFLELNVSDELLKDITDKCLFENLKKVYEEEKEYPQEIQKMIQRLSEMSPDFKHPNIFRKGMVGDWKSHFTVAQNEQFDALYQTEMKDCNLGDSFQYI